MLKRTVRNECGFALLEILMALLIFLIALKAMTMIGANSAQSNIKAVKTMDASVLAKNKMEDITMRVFGTINTGTSVEEYNTIKGYEKYKRTTTVAAGAFATKKITVTIHWNPNKDVEVYRLESIMSDVQ